MTRVPGLSLEQLDRLGDDYAGLVAHSLAWAVDDLSGTLGPVTTPEDLAALREGWAELVEKLLLPALGVAFEVGAAQVRVGVRDALGLTAEPEDADGDSPPQP